MRFTYRAIYFMLFCLLSMTSVSAQEGDNSDSSAWTISFMLEEHFRGSENLPRMIHLEADAAGNYTASYHLISDDPEISKEHVDKGVLAEGRVSHLKDWVSILQQSDITNNPNELTLGYGASLAPGWQGQLTIQAGEATKQVKFNSLRSENLQRPPLYNQLATFIFDLKRLTLSKFGLNRKRLTKPSE